MTGCCRKLSPYTRWHQSDTLSLGGLDGLLAFLKTNILAQKWKIIEYFEVAAKHRFTNWNISKLIASLCTEQWLGFYMKGLWPCNWRSHWPANLTSCGKRWEGCMASAPPKPVGCNPMGGWGGLTWGFKQMAWKNDFYTYNFEIVFCPLFLLVLYAYAGECWEETSGYLVRHVRASYGWKLVYNIIKCNKLLILLSPGF